MNHSQELIDHDKNISNNKIENQIMPKLLEAYGYTEYLSVENIDHPVLLRIDREAGIDGFLINSTGMDSISTRVSSPRPNGRAYENYTIRYKKDNGAKTEYQKLLEHYHNNQLRTKYTIQICYNSDGSWIAARILTDVLVEYIIEWFDSIDQIACDNAVMLVIPWLDIKRAYRGKDVITYTYSS